LSGFIRHLPPQPRPATQRPRPVCCHRAAPSSARQKLLAPLFGLLLLFRKSVEHSFLNPWGRPQHGPGRCHRAHTPLRIEDEVIPVGTVAELALRNRVFQCQRLFRIAVSLLQLNCLVAIAPVGPSLACATSHAAVAM